MRARRTDLAVWSRSLVGLGIGEGGEGRGDRRTNGSYAFSCARARAGWMCGAVRPFTPLSFSIQWQKQNRVGLSFTSPARPPLALECPEFYCLRGGNE